MLDRTGPAVMAGSAPSLTRSFPVTDRLSAADWPGSGTAVSGATTDGSPADDSPSHDSPADDSAAHDSPAMDGPAYDGPAGGGPGPVVSWTGGVTISQVLSAVHRYQRHRAGLDLPAWGDAGHAGKPNDPPPGDPEAGRPDDELSEEAVTAGPEDRGRVLSVAALGGH